MGSTQNSGKDLEKEDTPYDRLINSIFCGYALHEIICDKDGKPTDYKFLEVNPAFEKITGLKAKDITGRTAKEVLPGLEESWIEKYGKVALTGESIRFENYTKSLDCYFEVTAFSPRQNQFVTAFTDITERKRKELKIIEDEKNLRSYIDSAPYGVFVADDTGHFIQVNPAAVNITGYSEKELLTMKTHELALAEDLPLATETFQRLFEGGEATGEFRFVRKDGEVHWWSFSSKKLSGNRFLGFTKDITEQKNAEEMLKESEKRYKLLHNASFGGIVIHDKGTILECNQGLSDITLYSRDELIGMDGLLLIAEDSRDFVMDKILSGYEKSYEAKGVRKNGEEYPVRIEARNIPLDGKEVRATEFRDISQQKKTEESLRLTRYSIEHVSDALIWTDSSGKITDVNQAACKMFGYSREELLREKITDIDSHYKNGTWDLFFEEIRKKKTFTFESEIILKDGNKISIEITPNYLKYDNIERNCSLIRDVTERNRIKETLEKRMIALMRPLDNSEGLTFEDLFNLDEIQKIQDDFSAATGVASIITRTDGTPITKPSNFCRLCSCIIRKTEKGLANCLISDATIGRACKTGPTIQPCLSGGLRDAGAGITVGGKHIANWLIGQIRDDDMTEEDMRKYAREIGSDEEETVRAFWEVPSMPKDRFEKIAKALFTLASQLSTFAYQNVQQARFITEREAAEIALSAEKESLAVTLRSIGDGVITTDIEGKVVLLNKVAETLTGWTIKEAAGRPLPEVFNVIDELTGEPVENPARKVLATGKIVELTGQTCLRSKEGRRIIIADSGAPIHDKDSRIIGVVLVFRDMTEKQKMDQFMQNSQKLESLGVLAGGIAHDFNNLLSGIFGYLEMAMERTDDSKVYNFLSESLKNIERARAFTRQLITFAKGGAPIKEIASLFPFISETVQFALSGSAISCRFDISDNLWNADFDKNQIAQVIDNLTINALQAMPGGGSLIVSARNVSFSENEHISLSPGDYIEIAVKDTGIGIPKEYQRRIFDPYYTTKPAGHGLGLSSCYSIINRHGGYIDLESEPGRGSTFFIWLPAASASGKKGSLGKFKQHQGTGKFLVMDDEESVRSILELMLSSFGYDVILTENGREAVDYYQKEKEAGGDVVGMIFDLTVPGGMGGKEAADHIRKISADVPIFVASGYSSDPIMADPKSFGLTESLSKPFLKSELSDMLEKNLS